MLRGIPRPLGFLLAVSALLTLAWSFTTAPFQNPDERAHYSYVQYLAETGHKPAVTTPDLHPDSTQTAGVLGMFNLDQLVGAAGARPGWTRLEDRRYFKVLDALPASAEKDGSGPNPIAKNPPLYYAYEAIPYYIGSAGSLWDRLILMRLASGLLVVLAVACTWFAAAEVFTGLWPRTLAAGCVALLPQLSAMGGAINADSLLVAVWSAFTLAALRLVRRGPSARRILAVGALAGASLLTHGRGIAIVPPLVAAIVIAVVRARPPLATVARWVGGCAALLAATLVVYLELLAPKGGAYGGEVVLAPTGGLSLGGFLETTWQFYLPKLPFMAPRPGPAYGYRQMFIEGFFGRFGSLEVVFPSAVYGLIQAAAAAGLVGLAGAVAARWPAVRERWGEVVVLAVIAGSMIGLLHLASYRSLVGSGDPLIAGRYLLPLAAAFGLGVTFVLTSLRPRAGAVLGTLVLTSLLALNLSGLMLTFARFYG